MNIKLDKCPFCGGEAEFERLGNRKQSSIVYCIERGCKLESNEVGKHNGSNWNTRKKEQQIKKVLKELMTWIDIPEYEYEEWPTIEKKVKDALK